MNAYYGALLFLFIVSAVGFAIWVLVRVAAERRLVERRLTVRGNAREDARLLSLRFAELFDDQERIRKHINKDGELALAMHRAGYRAASQRAMLYGIQVLLPLATLVLTGLWILIQGYSLNSLLAGVSVVIISVLVPKRVINSKAEERLKRIDDELSLFVQMLRILFDAGLAVEQALRVMAKESGAILPEMVYELTPILRRAEQGLDLESELGNSATALDHMGYTDVMVIVRQMLKQGGSARASLSKLIEVMESRRLTDMQEKVSKLTAKMTVVMIVFFFPALIILLTGPGFISIGDAMGNM
ncbi:type II secretion system protein F (GspF) [Paraperlucidibaca baekdonensis]|uniref:Type II secretion system protein F (GspF) n=1 Tax=Paraperlucidibaca baekdonensis TaxID=748120 RepID=A0A3E0H6B3_9GAMM|nr:type II secretion system F family protein [Paraperlucidibaca baekdonensis]REH39033.1 type II secretion system protein F (GspF) [Paraperlucidibaca baekdonensis]